jgi:hypothetical protein
MSSNKENTTTDMEILIREISRIVKSSWKYLLSKWVIVTLFGFGGGAIGLVVSLLSTPDYKAHLSFALIENSGSSSGLAALASSFGLGSFGSSNDAFSGENLLEIIRSRHAIEQALLTGVDYKGKKQTLVEGYIQSNKMRKGWAKSKNAELKKLVYPIGQDRKSFSRTQDSVLYTIYKSIVKSGDLSVVKKDKKTSIVNLDYTSKDELFSKLFAETLMSETYRFYKEARTSLSRSNIEMMQHTADSIKHLYELSLYRGATVAQINLNPAFQVAAVPKVKQENNAQMYAAIYGEVMKNLEALKLDLAKQTPLVQIIDTPILPLEKERIGKAKGIIVGGLIGGILITIYLLGGMYLHSIMKKKQ